jgi:hypothetical protein
MDKRTYFKTPEGGMYSVSERVMDIGHEPAEGVVEATEEDIKAFKQRQETLLSNGEKISKLSSLLENNLLSEDLHLKLLEGIKSQEETKKIRVAKEATEETAKLAEEATLLQQRITDRKAAKEAVVEARRQAILEAERLAAEEAERLAALEASKPRRFSAA